MSSQYSFTARQILGYLADHSQAKDTVEGIASWWLFARRIQHSINEVQEALSQLTAGGLVIESEPVGTPTLYQINEQRMNDVRTILSEESDD